MIKDKNVLIVTSLLQLFYTGKLKRLIDHPLPLMKKNGLKVVLSSSDPALFDSNINREYTLARDLFFISYKDCMDMEKLAFEEKLMK
jgi:adenosine deaminase